MTPDPFPSEPIPGPDPGACPDCGGWRKAGVIHNCTPDLFPNELVEAAARAFHENYERLAPDYGYKTREASAVAWEGVPEKNRSLMLATVAAVLPLIRSADGQKQAKRNTLSADAPQENPYRDRIASARIPADRTMYQELAEAWDAGRSAERARLAEARAAIDRAVGALRGASYVGGPTEAEAFQPGFAAVVRHAARSADAPQENPWRGPSAGHNGDAPVEFYAWQDGFAAGRSAERARLAEIDVMAFGKATCARFTYAEDQPYEAVGDRDSLRLRAFLDAYLRAALSEGTPDKEDTDA